MKLTYFILNTLIMILEAASFGQQRPPAVGPQPIPPPPRRIEVRFAEGTVPVICNRFELTVKTDKRQLIKGSYASGFSIPKAAEKNKDTLDIRLECGEKAWHFTQVPHRAFLRGYWWVGTDYPPFQDTFSGDKIFENAAWIKYLIVDPSYDSGFDVYRYCPMQLQNQKPGPCFLD